MQLLDEGSTVPFIARYRKEVTGSLDDAQLRTLEERLRYLRELDRAAGGGAGLHRGAGQAHRRAAGRADRPPRPSPASRTSTCPTSRSGAPRRRSPARPAWSRWPTGCSPIRRWCPKRSPPEFVTEDVADAAAALDGARHILIERAAEDAELVGAVREKFWNDGTLRTAPKSEEAAKSPAAQKFRDYFEYSEPLEKMPSHRVLAVMRGEKEEILSLTFDGGEDDGLPGDGIAQRLGVDMTRTPARPPPWLATTVRLAWRTKLMITATVDARVRLRQRAEEDAVAVFARNLKDLLLAAPAGTRTTLGLDPGFRTGVKVAVVDGTGKVVDTCAIFPHQPQKQWDTAKATLAALVARHGVELIAVGNGTASRETDALAAELIADITKAAGRRPRSRRWSVEAGASVYSASAYASHELPTWTSRCAARCRSRAACRTRWPNW